MNKNIINYVIAFIAGYKLSSKINKKKIVYRRKNVFVDDIFKPNVVKCVKDIVHDTIYGPKRSPHYVDYSEVKRRRHRRYWCASTEFRDIWDLMTYEEAFDIAKYINQMVGEYGSCTMADVNDKFVLGMKLVADAWGWTKPIDFHNGYSDVIDGIEYLKENA